MVFVLNDEIPEESLAVLNDAEIEPGWRVASAIENLNFKPSMKKIENLINAVKSHEEIVNPIYLNDGDAIGKDIEGIKVVHIAVADPRDYNGSRFISHGSAVGAIRNDGFKIIGHVDLSLIS